MYPLSEMKKSVKAIVMLVVVIKSNQKSLVAKDRHNPFTCSLLRKQQKISVLI